jgi:hypothetical protein
MTNVAQRFDKAHSTIFRMIDLALDMIALHSVVSADLSCLGVEPSLDSCPNYDLRS